jgi:hypothetical protein
MVDSSIIYRFPLWALIILSASIVLLSIELGWRLGNRRRQRSEDEKKAPVSAAVGATLGLLAFLLAFTFGMSASRFDARKQNVVQEANAIGTTYLRADFLPQPAQDEAKQLLRKYTALRAGGMTAIMSPKGMQQTAAIQDRLWEIAVAEKERADTVATGLFIQTLNEMIDMDGVRIAGIRYRIPDTIWIMLCIVTIFSMAAMGYEFGLTGARSWPVTILLMIVFTTVIMLIADLDRPQSGYVLVSQQALIDLLTRMGVPAP